jgi:predicted metal-dependent enzyme (double-stranded beta helix superfamily)
MSNTAVKVAYKPLGLLLGVGAGAVAGLVFKQVWRLIDRDEDAPNPTDEDRAWSEILLAAAVQGTIFALVKATVDRSGAVAVRKATGQWPG